MKKILTVIISAAMILSLALFATGCSSTTAASTQTQSGSAVAETTAASSVSGSLIDASSLFTDRDLAQSADTSDAVTYTVEDGQDITITESGVYIIKGTAENCTVTVNAQADDAKVQLVLDGVSITNTDSPAIYVVSADKCFITTTDSVSTLTVTGTFAADGDTNIDAVIFSKDDLVLNGTGTLNISSTGNGITSKDDLTVTGGTYSIDCAKHALEGKDSIAVCGGTFTLDAGKDGLHSENSDDETLGYIYISGGTFDITSDSDGIHATTAAEIDGGTFTISSAEGIEATSIQINGGTISISASDDGINASAKSSAYEVAVEINGGDITIVMGSGDTDAVDANGSIYVNGGTINITAPTSSFDYDTAGEINGGTVIVNGEQITEMPAQMMGGGQMGKGGMTGGKRA